MATLENFKEDLPLLVEAGLIAIKQGDEESALKLFKAVGILDAKNLVRKVGFGLISMYKMELRTAKKFFEEVLQEDPNHYQARSFLAFSCILFATQDKATLEERIASLKKGGEIAEGLVKDKSAPESTKTLASSLLNWEKELQDKGAAIAKEKK